MVLHPDKLEQGKITRVMKKLVKFPIDFYLATFGVFRIAQMIAFYFVDEYIWHSPHESADFIFIIVLYLDDIYFNDDDKWKKRWQTLKNKIKWKMTLPQAQHEST